MTATRRRTLLRAGLDDFERGAYFEAHERWEDWWRAAPEPERTWVQGLIQLAAAWVKVGLCAWAPAARLSTRALGKLEGAPAVLEEIDLDAARALAANTVEACQSSRAPAAMSLRAAAAD